MTNSNQPFFIPISLLGKGSFGCVLEAIDKETQEKVAMKRIHKLGKFLSRESKILFDIRGVANVVEIQKLIYSSDDNGLTVQNLIFNCYDSKNTQ